jgi:hypothetical protein
MCSQRKVAKSRSQRTTTVATQPATSNKWRAPKAA